MKDDLEAIRIKLKFADVDNFISIGVEDNNVILKDVAIDIPFEYFKIPVGINVLKVGCCSGINIMTVVVPETVILIEDNCFANCNKLQRILIPESLLKFERQLKMSNRARIEVV